MATWIFMRVVIYCLKYFEGRNNTIKREYFIELIVCLKIISMFIAVSNVKFIIRN